MNIVKIYLWLFDHRAFSKLTELSKIIQCLPRVPCRPCGAIF